MKIIHYIPSIDQHGGGTTVYLQLLSSELHHMVDLVIATGVSPNPVNLPNCKTFFFDVNLKRFLVWEKEFKNFLNKEKPDIVHINGIWMPQCWFFQRAAQSLGIKIVLSPHGMLEPWILNRNPWKKKLALLLYQHKAIRRADVIHTTAQSELNQIRNLGYNQKAVVIPNGIDLSEVKAKTQWSKKNNTFRLLFLSRVHLKKGIELLIDAVTKLNNPKIEVIIAGEGEENYITSLKQQCEKNNIEHQFKFVGGIYGVAKWEAYKQCDVFILPTYSENFGIVVAEALAVGVPVITTTGTPWNELETQHCGWWIDLSVENLMHTIQQAMTLPPETLKEMGKNGANLIRKHYDIKGIAEQIKNMYQNNID